MGGEGIFLGLAGALVRIARFDDEGWSFVVISGSRMVLVAEDFVQEHFVGGFLS